MKTDFNKVWRIRLVGGSDKMPSLLYILTHRMGAYPVIVLIQFNVLNRNEVRCGYGYIADC